MKKTRLLNASLSHHIATLGHTDSLTICDAGLPIPNFVERIDLALEAGVPSFLQTFDVVTDEMFVERAVLAEEIKEKNPQIHTALLAALAKLSEQQGNNIAIEYITHEEFKVLSFDSKAIVRTGEFSPYANIILYSGVPF
ncbi:D-ribose pyranase [Canicola haemoglobinophilus]|uniref:D-ribose pyranase n=1 Tax=Canicola haemoglobinophilus TaxID=733 RepID=A0A1V4B2J3_9PAST|nr:D-ribose pyranase [Canicola haemoglobinophilus]MBN6711328.1 D-ribose pyranase [Canicola haemoglobinophilus]MBN6711845.1 D-ribose pyranase [Canicola haemoglobinophilus]OOS01492.1 D-ribose pyranase [Canicola haemoglobinophilus]STO54580.1 D-ribose pyranase [Canicola haemoglobinophilus]STO59946.1 D-ribose pyranase [Canicola haemoglobinophilus]